MLKIKRADFVTATERVKTVNAAIDEASTVLYMGMPDKEELKSLISMINNTILCVTSAPGYIPQNITSLYLLQEEAYRLYSKKYGKIIQKGLDVTLE